MKQVLVASDLSSRAEAALRRVVATGPERGWNLRILHVIDDDHPAELAEQERASRRDLLETQAEQLRREANVTVDVDVAVGDPYREIVKDAERVSADLIVLGRHRRRPLRDFIVGTTVDRVLRSSLCPTLVVKDDEDVSYRRVMAATDFSETSRHALVAASRLGLLDQTILSLVHAFQVIGKRKLYQGGMTSTHIEDIVAKDRQAATAQLHSFLRRAKLEHELQPIVVEGDPLSSIQRVVTKRRPDLLIVGTTGRGHLSRALLGSVATGLINNVSCDVLAVPPMSR